jgi:hypothetical protein
MKIIFRSRARHCLRAWLIVPVCLLGLNGRLLADAPAWSTQLLARVDRIQASSLPPHPRLMLSAGNISHVRSIAHTSAGEGYWKIVTDWLDTECLHPPMPDPAPQGRAPGGGRDIGEFRRIQAAAEQVESHIVLGAAAYLITHDAKYLTLTRAWVLDVAKWNPHGPTGIASDDYAARQTLHSLAVAYDGLYDEWTPEERAMIRTCILARGADLYTHLFPLKLDPYNNHPWFQCSALVDAGLALADESADADRWWRYGAELYLTRFLPLGGHDGGWHEGINYLTFTMKYVGQFADALAASSDINLYQEIPWLRQAGYFRLYLAPAGSIGIYFNDTRPLALQQWDKPTAFRFAAATQDPVLEWYAESLPQDTHRPTSSFYNLLYRDPTLVAQPPTSLPLTREFRDIGWVVARTDLMTGKDVQFGFKSQPWPGPTTRARGHDHPDANNFLLNYLGHPLLVDSGYYDYYNSPHHTKWTFTGRAHNTLLIDGEGQLPQRPGKMLSVVSRPGEFDWMEGEGAAAYPDGLLQSWRRQIVYVRPDIFVIRDVVRPTRPATITWLLHGASPFELDGQSFVCRNDEAAVAGIIALPTDLKTSQSWGFPAGAEPDRTTPAGAHEFADQSHLNFTTPEKVGNTTFITVFCPSEARELKRPIVTVKAARGGDSVTVRLPDGRSVEVDFAPVPADGGPTRLPGVHQHKR